MLEAVAGMAKVKLDSGSVVSAHVPDDLGRKAR